MTIGRDSSHNNNHTNRRRLTLDGTGVELDGAHFERIDSLVDSEANANVMQEVGQRDGIGESDTRSQIACVGDAVEQVAGIVGKVNGQPERIQQIDKENVIETAVTAG